MTPQPESAVDVQIDSLVARVRRGDIGALARALTWAERDTATIDALLARLLPVSASVPVIGITGSPGVGKSTLTDAVIGELRGRGLRVAVVAVDPSSPLSGGAVLGDRIRMQRHASDSGVFIRSVAARGASGGLSPAALAMICLLRTAGWDRIVVETVGAGQGEWSVRDAADAVVLATAPGLGDDVQAIKAGIGEIGDIIVVNKSDLAGADTTARELASAAALRDRSTPVPVLLTRANAAEGIPALVDALQFVLDQRNPQQQAELQQRRLTGLLMLRCEAKLRARIAASDCSALVGAVASGRRTVDDACTALLAEAAR